MEQTNLWEGWRGRRIEEQRAMKLKREDPSWSVCPEMTVLDSRSGNQVSCNKAFGSSLHRKHPFWERSSNQDMDAVTPSLTYRSIQAPRIRRRMRLWLGLWGTVQVADSSFPAPRNTFLLSLPMGCRRDTPALGFQAADG